MCESPIRPWFLGDVYIIWTGDGTNLQVHSFTMFIVPRKEAAKTNINRNISQQTSGKNHGRWRSRLSANIRYGRGTEPSRRITIVTRPWASVSGRGDARSDQEVLAFCPGIHLRSDDKIMATWKCAANKVYFCLSIADLQWCFKILMIDFSSHIFGSEHTVLFRCRSPPSEFSKRSCHAQLEVILWHAKLIAQSQIIQHYHSIRLVECGIPSSLMKIIPNM